MPSRPCVCKSGEKTCSSSSQDIRQGSWRCSRKKVSILAIMGSSYIFHVRRAHIFHSWMYKCTYAYMYIRLCRTTLKIIQQNDHIFVDPQIFIVFTCTPRWCGTLTLSIDRCVPFLRIRTKKYR